MMFAHGRRTHLANSDTATATTRSRSHRKVETTLSANSNRTENVTSLEQIQTRLAALATQFGMQASQISFRSEMLIPVGSVIPEWTSWIYIQGQLAVESTGLSYRLVINRALEDVKAVFQRMASLTSGRRAA